jgi:hypothetical protein
MKSPLWTHGANAAELWRCPADKSKGKNAQKQRVPRVRSSCINPPLGGPSDPNCGWVGWLDFSSLVIFHKQAQMQNPGSAQTLIFFDERAESMSESVFYLSMATPPRTRRLVDSGSPGLPPQKWYC